MENKVEVLNESVIEESAAAAYEAACVCEKTDTAEIVSAVECCCEECAADAPVEEAAAEESVEEAAVCEECACVEEAVSEEAVEEESCCCGDCSECAADAPVEEAAAVEEASAAEFDEDEEFVPAITFADDYDDPVDDRDEDYYESNAARVRIHMKEEAEKAEPAVEQKKKRTAGAAIQNFFYHHKAAVYVAGAVAIMAALYIVNHLVG